MVPLKNYIIIWMDGAFTKVNFVESFQDTPDGGLTLISLEGNFHILDKSKVRFIAEK